MQNLAGYGSDSDDDVAGPSTATSVGTTQTAETSNGTAKDSLPDRQAVSSAPPPALTRIKGAASSRSHTPLSGVRLPTSTASSPRSGPSSAALGKRRESSTSPPPFARTNTSDRNGNAATPPVGLAVNLDTLADFGIPPIPTGPCAPSVQAKLANFHNLRLSRGLHFNDSLHASKAFRNPRIYAKLVEFVDVDETGSNWDKKIWDSKAIGPDATSSRLAELQKIRSEAKQAGASQRSSIAFAPSTSSTSAASRAADDPRNAGLSSRRDHDRDRERDREYRPRDRDREKDWDKGGEGKKSRWDRGGAAGRDRSRSPRRR